jgi:hypothetical protein
MRGSMSEEASLDGYYLDRGFVVVYTCTTGDCAPDARSRFNQDASGPISWKLHRTRVRDSMEAEMSAGWVREAFGTGQERETPRRTEAALAKKESSATTAEPPNTDKGQVPLQSGDDSHKKGNPIEDNVAQRDRQVVAWALNSVGFVDNVDVGDSVVETWLAKIGDDCLSQLRKEYSASTGTTKLVKARRKYQSTALPLRFSIGDMHIKWKRNRPDHAAPLRDFASEFLCL